MPNLDPVLYDKLLYLAWCIDGESDFQLAATRQAYESFLADTDVHSGDCTTLACPCSRCRLHHCEIEAQKMYNYLRQKD